MTHSALRKWSSDISGNVAMTFALMSLPIFAISGFAIDGARLVSLKNHAQQVADAASLAAARTFLEAFDVVQAETNARSTFAANILTAHKDATCTIGALAVSAADLTVSIEATCEAPTIFGVSLSGQQVIGATVVSTAAAMHKTADVAMMLDLSRSMNRTELDQLSNAAKRAAQITIGVQAGAHGRVSIVPFTSGVNAGDFGNKASGRASGDDPESDNRFGGAAIERVCVGERSGIEALTDARPIAGQFVGAPTVAADVFATGEFGNQTALLCPNSPVHPLDSDLARVNSALDNLARSPHRAGGNTAGHLGVAWSWYTLSPEWTDIWTDQSFGGRPSHAPHACNNPNIEKIAILMTDGLFQIGFHQDFASLDNTEQVRLVTEAAETLCAGMRARGITIYAIGYNAPTAAETMLENCAGDASRAFTTNVATDLEQIYEQISRRYLSVGLIE